MSNHYANFQTDPSTIFMLKLRFRKYLYICIEAKKISKIWPKILLTFFCGHLMHLKLRCQHCKLYNFRAAIFVKWGKKSSFQSWRTVSTFFRMHSSVWAIFYLSSAKAKEKYHYNMFVFFSSPRRKSWQSAAHTLEFTPSVVLFTQQQQKYFQKKNNQFSFLLFFRKKKLRENARSSQSEREKYILTWQVFLLDEDVAIHHDYGSDKTFVIIWNTTAAAAVINNDTKLTKVYVQIKKKYSLPHS